MYAKVLRFSSRPCSEYAPYKTREVVVFVARRHAHQCHCLYSHRPAPPLTTLSITSKHPASRTSNKQPATDPAGLAYLPCTRRTTTKQPYDSCG